MFRRVSDCVAWCSRAEHEQEHQVDHLISRYRELSRCPSTQRQRRGRQFNAFLAELLRRDGVEARSDQRGRDGWDEIDVHFTLGPTNFILEAKWQTKPVSWDPVVKLAELLRSRPSGCRAVFVSMSGYTRQAHEKARADGRVLLLDGTHVEALLAGLLMAPQFFDTALSVASRRGGSYVPLAEMMHTPLTESEPLPQLCRVKGPVEGFPAVAEPGVTVTDLLTVNGPWTTGKEIGGMAVDRSGELLWTTGDGVLRVDPHSGRTAWTAAPRTCDGPVLLGDNGAVTALSNRAAARFHTGGVDIVGGGFRVPSTLLPGPDGQAWVFSNTGARIGGNRQQHALTRLGIDLPAQETYDIDFPGQVHQAALTGAGALYLAGGGSSAITSADQGWRCPREQWVDPVPLTPTASAVAGEHTVLLAGPTAHGVEKALLAVDTGHHRHRVLAWFPNTTYVKALACEESGTVYLLTDIRGNDQGPRPHLVRIELPKDLR